MVTEVDRPGHLLLRPQRLTSDWDQQPGIDQIVAAARAVHLGAARRDHLYYSLASGFLSGKYRSAADLGASVRGEAVRKYLDARGFRILGALDRVAHAHGAKPAEVALAWLIAREGVMAPIVSAPRLKQLESLMRGTRLRLAPAEIDLLTAPSD